MSLLPRSTKGAKYVMALALAYCSGATIEAQVPCKTKALSVLERIRTNLEEAEQSRLYAKVLITVTPADPKQPLVKETMEMVAGDKRMAFVSPQVMTLDDVDARVVVMLMDKEVYIYDHVPSTKEPNEIWWRQTELVFNKGKLLTCNQSKANSGDVVVIEFDVADVPELGGTKTLRMELDETRGKPIRYHNIFGPNSPMRERTFEFLTYEPGKADRRVTTSVLTQVIPNGRLSSDLSGYALKDLRTPKTKTLRPTPIPE